MKISNKKKNHVTIDPFKAFLLHNCLRGYSLLGNNKEEVNKWNTLVIFELLKYKFKFRRGRTKELIVKALQIAMFKLLDSCKKPTTRKKDILELAASIINESLRKEVGANRLPLLKAKDIENALHSS